MAYAALSANPNLLQDMLQYIQQLEARVNGGEKTSDPSQINIQDFYCLPKGLICLAKPDWEIVDGGRIDLKGRLHVLDADGYLARKGNISFAVYHYFNRGHQLSVVNQAAKAGKPLPEPEPSHHVILLASSEMKEAMGAFVSLYESFHSEFPEIIPEDGLSSPYIWWYHYRRSHKIHKLRPRHAALMTKLTDWIEHTYGPLYDKIDLQFQIGRVSSVSMDCFARPGDILIGKSEEGIEMGYLVLSRPRVVSARAWPEGPPQWPALWKGPQNHVEDISESLGELNRTWKIKVRSYIYAGDFFTTEEELDLDYDDKDGGEIEIESLNLVPVRYCSPETQKRLELRGKTFWWCREKQLVSYEGDSKTMKKMQGQRFMVDFSTYQELHPANPYSRRRQNLKLKSEAKAFGGDRKPQGTEIYLFPSHIPGFDLRRKKWVDLEVDHIHPVTWNEQAFHSLVADEDIKQLVLALVTNQLAAEAGTDLIENKGNGLIMLLHGSPGTGKTFTAESVAEIAKKPLYPVTCGDIGTEPEAVEKYLASVFHLGKIWDCVVLLDEAEVFLEQRTLQDLKRNALVSVFLRALEYYEGILILTTNRVGTFDEAFKSRIQLALRYERLRDDQRKQIWRNFMDRLKSLGEEDNIDFMDVIGHLGELASYPMNGREIRNSITTGRQLAKFTKERMTFKHLKRAIGVAEKFDRYLAEVREGEVDEDEGGGGVAVRGKDGRYTDEFFARSDQIR
ncbi:putative AAA domain-containing protein [Cladorrhinum sp. PSN332]|nr:putative AAA domain-containing protein [Cladorrhinum sp. PSN332]